MRQLLPASVFLGTVPSSGSTLNSGSRADGSINSSNQDADSSRASTSADPGRVLLLPKR